MLCVNNRTGKPYRLTRYTVNILMSLDHFIRTADEIISFQLKVFFFILKQKIILHFTAVALTRILWHCKVMLNHYATAPVYLVI